MKISKSALPVLALVSSIQSVSAFSSVDSDKVIEFMGVKSLSFLAGIRFLALAGITVLFIFWLFMLIDCLRRDFPRDGDKIAWVIVIIFLQILGALIYYFVIRLKSKKQPVKEKVKKK